MNKHILLLLFILIFALNPVEACDIYINSLPYNITQNNTFYCLTTSSTNLIKTAIQFGNSSSWVIQNSTLDCQGYTLDGNKVSNTYGVFLNTSSTINNTIKNCRITDFIVGVYPYSSTNNILSNITANSNTYGIWLRYSSNNILSNITANSNSYGIGIASSPNNNFTDINLNNNSLSGTNPSSSNNNIFTNLIVNNNTISISSSNNNILTNITANNGGISLAWSNNSILTNIVLTKSGGSGVDITYSTNNTLTNVTAVNHTYGIYLDTSSNNILTTITSVNNTNSGINLYSSNDNTLTNIIANNNNGSAIHGGIKLYSSSRNILTNVTTNNNNLYGIRLYPDSSNNILTNVTSNNNYYGIEFESSSSNNILANITAINNSKGTWSWGIHLWSEASNNSFTSVTSENNSVGIGIGYYSSNNRFYDVTIITPTRYDIHLSYGGENYFINSVFNKSSIVFDTYAYDAKLYNQYYLDVYVVNNSGNPLDNATVIGNDTASISNTENPTSNFSALTNISGYIPRQLLTEFMANKTYNSTSGGYLYFTNYILTTSKIGYQTDSRQLNLTTNTLSSITLQGTSQCTDNAQCLGGYCVHNICRSTTFYCGDDYCDPAESCSFCIKDCGECSKATTVPVNIPSPADPTEFPPTVIELKELPEVGTPITLPATGLTIRLEPNFVLTAYPLTNKIAVIHNISKIEEPNKYKILLCNQTSISSYEIEVTIDLAYYCANYSDSFLEEPTINIFKFKENDWIPLITGNMIRNTTRKIVCGKIESTPYMIAGFQPIPTSETAFQAISDVNSSIDVAKSQDIDVSEANSLLNKAVYEYYSCNYVKAKAFADQALNSMVKISIPEAVRKYFLPISLFTVPIILIWYYRLMKKLKR